MTRIKRIREQLGWTQAQMGEAIGLTGPSVSRIENGQTPRVATEKLLDALERNLADLDALTAQARQDGAP